MRLSLLKILPLFLALTGAGCTSLRPSSILDQAGAAATFEDLVADLAQADVVVLGEEHDSDSVHDLQLRVTRALLDLRPDAVLSMEMFERPDQPALDLYLAGALSEAEFLEQAAPWPNYAEHYRPGILLAKERGIKVLAGNCHRPLASRVAKQGTAASQGDPWGPRQVVPMAGRYQELFFEAMGAMAGPDHAVVDTRLQKVFEAQCLKDEAMAEAITDHLAERAPARPLVIHWCGRFHSDFRLGTVERLARRRPDLVIRVVSGRKAENGGFDPAADAGRADWFWIVPR